MFLYIAIIVVYALGSIATWRRAVWLMIYSDRAPIDGTPSGAEWLFCGGMTAFAASIWPIAIPCYKLYEHGILQNRIAKPPKRDFLILKEQELNQRAWQIAQAERELGIGDEEPKHRYVGRYIDLRCD